MRYTCPSCECPTDNLDGFGQCEYCAEASDDDDVYYVGHLARSILDDDECFSDADSGL